MFAIDTLPKRITHYRKAFARGLGRRPTALERSAMNRAAMLAAQAEMVLADPVASVNDKVRIDGAARRARIDMQAVLNGHKHQQQSDTPLDRYLGNDGGAA